MADKLDEIADALSEARAAAQEQQVKDWIKQHLTWVSQNGAVTLVCDHEAKIAELQEQNYLAAKANECERQATRSDAKRRTRGFGRRWGNYRGKVHQHWR
jgi:hypothetical protein